MVQTVRDIVNRAMRKLGVRRAGGQASASEAADGLASLSSFYMECVTGGTFGRVANVIIDSAQTLTAGGNQHINITTTDPVTVDLPVTVPACYWYNYEPYGDYGWPWFNPNYGAQGVTVPPDKSVVMVTDQDGVQRAVYVYDGTIQQWMRVDALTLNDEAPLSARNYDGLAAVVAMRLADEFGDNILSAITVSAANKYRLALVTNYGGYDLGCC